jgi:predicted ester cyclase
MRAMRSRAHTARMPIHLTQHFDGATLDQYDEVIARLGFEHGGPGAPGGISHAVVATDAGIRVDDVWESREAADAFASGTLAPLLEEVGIGAPRVEIEEVHNHLTAGTPGVALVRRFFDELCNGRRGEVADEIIAADFVAHGPQAPPAEGPDGVRERVTVYQDALDGHWGVEEILVAGADRVVARWTGTGIHRGELMGVDPTHQPISVEAISEFRIADGKIAEEWTVWDALGLLQQVGAIPAAA